MSQPAVMVFTAGAVTAGLFMVGVFFLRFWTRARDPLFAVFGVAFTMLAASQAAAALSGLPEDGQVSAYRLRLAAFILIIVAVVGKNLRGRRRGGRRRLG